MRPPVVEFVGDPEHAHEAAYDQEELAEPAAVMVDGAALPSGAQHQEDEQVEEEEDKADPEHCRYP